MINPATIPDTKTLDRETFLQRGRYAHLFSEYEVDEKMVESYWVSQDCHVERLDVLDKRYPDFLIRFRNGKSALCEIKSFGGPETGDSDYLLDYPVDYRISNALYTGIRQLREYVAGEDVFRILFFVNHNDKLRFDSLVKLLDGEWDPLSRKFMDIPNARSMCAREERSEIDLYLWLRATIVSSSNSPSQHWGRLDRVAELCEAMQQKPNQLRLIPAA